MPVETLELLILRLYYALLTPQELSTELIKSIKTESRGAL